MNSHPDTNHANKYITGWCNNGKLHRILTVIFDHKAVTGTFSVRLQLFCRIILVVEPRSVRFCMQKKRMTHFFVSGQLPALRISSCTIVELPTCQSRPGSTVIILVICSTLFFRVSCRMLYSFLKNANLESLVIVYCSLLCF